MKSQITLWLSCGTIVLGLHFAFGAEETWERLTDYEKPKNAQEQQAWDLLKTTRHQGSEGARRLIAEMPRIPLKYHKNALNVLSRTQCREAQEYLLSQALSSSDTYAAIVYLEYGGDSSAARKLLNSTNSEIQLLALGGLMGSHGIDPVILDREAWEQVRSMLTSDNVNIRRRAASVVGNDTGSEVPAAEKVEGLIAAVHGVEALPGAGKRLTAAITELSGTEFEFTYAGIFNALANPRLRVSPDDLRRSTPTVPGAVRDCLVIARAFRGDTTTKEDLHRISRENQGSVIRARAIQALSMVGTVEDVPVLEETAGKDAEVVKNWMPGVIRSPEDEKPRDYYPVREAAKEAIQAIQKRAASSTPSTELPKN